MSESSIEKSQSPNPDEVLAAIQSFNDPAIITNIFKELNWNYSIEIKETLMMAKQNANLSIKFKAIKHLRELIREAAETAGYTANVSQTIPNAHGGTTTFHAKRIAGMLNPTKQIKSIEKETQNDKEETRTELDRGSDRSQSQSTDSTPPTRRADSERNGGLGELEPSSDGQTPGTVAGAGETDNPCIKTRPPTCDQDLFPGISSAEE